jgi:hypothetical protein
MAAYPTSDPPHGSRNGWFAGLDFSSLGSSIIAGLGAFGLAANGICPPLLDQSASVDPGRDTSPGSDQEKQAEHFLIARDSRLEPLRRPQC